MYIYMAETRRAPKSVGRRSAILTCTVDEQYPYLAIVAKIQQNNEVLDCSMVATPDIVEQIH